MLVTLYFRVQLELPEIFWFAYLARHRGCKRRSPPNAAMPTESVSTTRFSQVDLQQETNRMSIQAG